jgi:hypothetical protein
MQAPGDHLTGPAEQSIQAPARAFGKMPTMNVAPRMIIDILVALLKSASISVRICASLPGADGTSDGPQQIAC